MTTTDDDDDDGDDVSQSCQRGAANYWDKGCMLDRLDCR